MRIFVNLLKKILLLFAISVLTACSGIKVEEYAATPPDLNLKTFFNGNLRAYGMLQNRTGRVTRRFVADIFATWDGENGRLVEEFHFDDEEVQHRTWLISHQGNGVYVGTADDVLGEATGRASGMAFHWQYDLLVPWKDNEIAVELDDWLFLVDEEHLLNKTTLTKFGFKVGDLTLVIEKL